MGRASRRKKNAVNGVPGNRGRHETELTSSPGSQSSTGLQGVASNRLTPILIILIVSFAVYFNALSGDFVYDDKLMLEDQSFRDIRNIPAVFSRNLAGSLHIGQTTLNFYRPMMSIFGMFNYYLFGLKPWGFHLVNVLVHCGVSVLVFLISQRLLSIHKSSVSSGYLSAPFMAAMLFALHPIHTEAVTWISARSDVFFSFFYLLSFYLYVSFRAGLRSVYLLSVLSFSVAAFSKEPAITLPVILAAYDYVLKRSDEGLFKAITRYMPYIAVSGIYLLMRHYALGGFAPTESHTDLSAYESVINVLPLFKDYLISLLLPLNLNLWHAFHPIRSLLTAQGVISLFVACIFILGSVAAYRKNRMVFFCLILSVVPLLPAFYIKGIVVQPFAERYLYLPSVGYALLLALFAEWARAKLPGATWSIMIVLIALSGAYAVGTIDRNNVWKNNFNLWSDTVKKSPDIAVAHNNLGIEFQAQGQTDSAISEFQAALRLNPDYAEAHNNLGLEYKSQGQVDRAMTEYETALRLKPDNAEAHNNLANVYQSQGKWDKAISEYQTALRLKPDSVETHSNLGVVFASQSQWDSAISEFQTALRLKPDYAEAHNNLGNVYQSRGKVDKAISEFQTALRLKPDFAMAHTNLGNAYQSQGKWDSAISEFQAALRLKPGYHEAQKNLNDIISRRR